MNNTKKSSHETANLFMLFLLSFNVMLAVFVSYLYREFWHGTPLGGIFAAPWWLVANQIAGLLVPMFIFRALVRGLNAINRNVLNRDVLNKTNAVKKTSLGFANIFMIITLSLLLQPFMMLFSALASLIFPNPVTALISDLSLWPLPVALVVIAITPAICEEWVFRGYIQSLYKGQPIVIAALVNGLFFGIIHFSLHQFAYAFAMGVVFALMVYFTGSIFSAILSHFVVNASQYTLGYIAIRTLGPVTGPPTNYEIWENIFGLLFLNILVLPLLAVLSYLFIKHNKIRNPLIKSPIIGSPTIGSPTIGSPIIRNPNIKKPEDLGLEERFIQKIPLPFNLVFWVVIVVYIGLMLLIYS